MISAPLSYCQTSLQGPFTAGGALNIPEGGEGEPQQEDELEGIVEGEPVHDAEQALQDAVQIC